MLFRSQLLNIDTKFFVLSAFGEKSFFQSSDFDLELTSFILESILKFSELSIDLGLPLSFKVHPKLFKFSSARSLKSFVFASPTHDFISHAVCVVFEQSVVLHKCLDLLEGFVIF